MSIAFFVATIFSLCIFSSLAIATESNQQGFKIEFAIYGKERTPGKALSILRPVGQKWLLEQRSLPDNAAASGILGKLSLDALQMQSTQAIRVAGYPIGVALIKQSDFERVSQTRQLLVSVYLGEISAVDLRNNSRVDDETLRQVISRALCEDGFSRTKGCALETDRLERATQLLQAIPGVKLGSTPALNAEGAGIGQTTIVFDVDALGEPYFFDVSADNQGTQSTGVARLNLTASGNNVIGIGDAWALTATTTNEDFWSGSANVSAPFGDDGLRWATGVSRSLYTIYQGGIVINGAANTASAGFNYPFIRGLDFNLVGALDGLYTDTSISYQDYGIHNYSTLRYGRLSLISNNGDRPSLLGLSAWQGNLAFTFGTQQNNTPLDLQGPQRAGDYRKLAGNFRLKQNLNADGDIFGLLNLQAQVVNKNIDFSEMLGLGGINAVRAYSPEEGSLAQGLIIQSGLKWRLQAPDFLGGQIVPGLLADIGTGMINRQTWPGWQQGYPTVPNVTNNRTLSGYGATLDWVLMNGLMTSLSYARRFAFSSQSWVNPGSADGRVWLSVSWRYQ
jgi:hemolysin activation/secretion protein